MDWHAKVRKYKDDLKGKHLPRREVDDHPLRPVKTRQSTKLKKSGDSVDETKENKPPITVRTTKPKTSSSWGGLDPLSAGLNLQSDLTDSASFGGFQSSRSTKLNDSVKSYLDDDFDYWNNKKVSILNKYTTAERLSIKTSFLSGGNANMGSISGSVRNLQNTSVAEKVKHRLEQLDDFEEGSIKEMLNLTQQEYVNHIEELNSVLQDSWESDQRVKALRMAIQCAKLLSDVAVIQFYPSKFVLVTDILDNFGSLVYKRIYEKAGSIHLTDDSAKETCKNWFFKIASIRELIPRFYVETAILKTYGFLIEQNENEYIKALQRLNKMIRGIGDPLVSVYARAYLARVAVKIVPQSKTIFQEILADFLESIIQISSPVVHSLLNLQRIDFPTYYSLFIPALDWIFQCLTYKASHILLEEIFEKFKQNSTKINNIGCSALVLNSIFTCFRSEFVSTKAMEFLEILKSISYLKSPTKDAVFESDSVGNHFSTYLLVYNFGASLNESSSYWMGVEHDEKLQILNDIWKLISKLKSPVEYMSCVDVWIEFVIKQFGYKEINTVLGNIIKHLLPDRTFEDHYNQLVAVITKIVSLSPENDFAAIFSMNNFMPFLDLLQKESVKVEACKVIVENFVKHFNENVQDEDNLTTSDPVILNSLTYLCKTMHDSVNALTLEDEKRHIGLLIVSFLKRVSFKKDFEAQLNFYVESRGNFSNLDTVLCFLVQRVNTLAMDTRSIVKGYHTKKTTAFVRACLAYSFITIPSLEDIIMRLQLYLSSSHVALLNCCLPQTDAFLKAAITLLPNLPKTISASDGRPKSTEPFLLSYTSEMLSFLVIVPDHPEHEPLYLLRGLLNVLRDYKFESSMDTKIMIYMNIINFLSTAAQENYPYHINRIDSNDTLYGNDENFMSEISSLSKEVIEEMLNIIKRIGEEKQFKRQAQLSLELFYRLIIHGESKFVAKLALNLWQLAHKNNCLDSKRSAMALDLVRSQAKRRNDQVLQELIRKIDETM